MPPLGAAATSPGYRPRSSTNHLKEFVEDHLEEFLRVYDERFAGDHGPLHPRVKSLKVRGLCPSCGQRRAIE